MKGFLSNIDKKVSKASLKKATAEWSVASCYLGNTKDVKETPKTQSFRSFFTIQINFLRLSEFCHYQNYNRCVE